jgi:C-type mannose receptor
MTRAPSSVPSALGTACVVLFVLVSCTKDPPLVDVGIAKLGNDRITCEGTAVHAASKDFCIVTTRRPYHDAVKDCERLHGTLATVADEATSRELAGTIASPWGYGSGLWLGCSDEEQEGSWTCDGKPMSTFTNWAPSQPDNESALDDCLEWLADTGKWNDSACSTQLGYVCEGNASLRCKARRMAMGPRRFFCAHGEDPKDWDGAKKACIADGGKLAIPTSDEDSRALFQTLKLPSRVPSKQPLEGLWIGMSDEAEEGKFRWVNGAPTTFTNWLPGEPSDGGGKGEGEDCVTLTLGSGKWNDVDCGLPLPYLCELHQ